MSNDGSNQPYDPYGQQGQPQYGEQSQPQYGGQQYGSAPSYQPMPGSGGPVGTPPANNLVLAILCTVLCCLPLGIVAILQATKVNTLWQQGDVAGAQEAADKAKKFSIIGAVIGLVFTVLYVIFVVAASKN